MVRRFFRTDPPATTGLLDAVRSLVRPLRTAQDLDPLLECGGGRDAHFEAEQNALVLKNAEAYYRTMVRGWNESWNLRDQHRAETLDRLLTHPGPGTKAVVWEHNTHIGDARFTDRIDDGPVNVGQLAGERYGEGDVVLVGFGTHTDTVLAGAEWEAPMERMWLPEAREDSWQDGLHRAGPGDKLLVFDPSPQVDRRHLL